MTEFARVQNPLGFEFWNGGVIVTCAPDIIFLKDTDGDDVADVRTIMLQGVDFADTHHGANNLVMGPDGGIYWQSGVFMVHNHEHPWGPSLQTGTSAMYRFDPRRFTIAKHADNSPNPHGIALTPGVIFMPPTAPAVARIRSAPRATASKCTSC
jgi:hypothetical protein